MTGARLAIPPDSWLGKAACRPEIAELFWPLGKKHEALPAEAEVALKVCSRCPAIRACGDWAIANGMQEGIWGGMRPDQLQRLVNSRHGRRR